MKIVCDACQAKYSISDDKVQGKVFKIRCKKCSNIIVVRGGAGGAGAEPAAPAAQEKDTRVYDYGYEGGGAPAADDAVWHLVINQDQVGPMTLAEVQGKFSSGEVDAETFAWREGFADWLPMSQVDAFAGFVTGGGADTTEASGPGGGGAAAVAAMFGGGNDESGTTRSDPNDLFASASASASKHAADDDGGDLFGDKPKAAAPAAASAASAQKLRGERNENSVLFSLNNLAQLASNSPAPAPSSSSSSSSGHATGASGGEGSGLIDIRSMANAYLGGSGGAAKPVAASSGVGSIDDLPVFGGGGFSEPAVIMPMGRPQANNKVLYLMIGAVGLLAVVAVIMVVILLKGNKTPEVAASDKTSETDKDKDKDKGGDTKPSETKPVESAAGSSAAGSGSAASGSDSATGSATQVATNDKQHGGTPAPAPHGGGATAPAPHGGGATAPAAPKGGGATAPPAAPKGGGATPPPAAPKGGATPPPAGGGDSCDEVSCVLSNYDGACCAKFKKAKGGGGSAPKPSGGGGDLPDQLDRGMISQGISGVKGKATACGDKTAAKGVVKVHVKVDGSGHVSSVNVSQTPDPGLGACVAAAVQKATFPKTQNGGSFSYPFPF